jgi:hypothetical protein
MYNTAFIFTPKTTWRDELAGNKNVSQGHTAKRILSHLTVFRLCHFSPSVETPQNNRFR